MSALRATRAARVARSALAKAPVQRRGYADAVADKLKLSLVLPHQTIYKSQDVVQVNVPAESGEMGILAQHVPSIEQLKPGLVEIIEEAGGSKQFFLSGGFAVVQPNSVLSINAVEGFPLEDFSSEAVASQISEAQKIASSSGSEQDIAEAKIELEVLESLQAALNLTSIIMSHHPRPSGSVAARVQALQEIRTVEDLAPRFPHPPLALQQHRDGSTPAAYGRRTESNFGSPMSRASQEDTNGTRGDARLPPGAFDPQLNRPIEERSDSRLPSRPSALRPSTSLAPRPRERQDPFASLTKVKQIRRHRSIEDLSDPTLQLSAMRARLKPHSEKKPLVQDVAGNRVSDQPLAMADLDDMIDYVKSSIEHQAAHDRAEVDSVLHADSYVPDSSIVRRWKSARGVQPSLDTLVALSVRHHPEQHLVMATDDWPSEKHQKHTNASPTHLVALKSLSPVKAKAAIFESMDQGRGIVLPQEAPPHRQVHVKKTRKSVSEYELPPGNEGDLHHRDHGPTIHRHREESTSTTKTASFDTARQCVGQEHHEEIPAVVSTIVKPTPEAVPRWRAFSKASSATPQATEESVMAIPEKDKHYPACRPGLVQSRIEGLFAASHRCQEHDQPLKLHLTAVPTRDRDSEIGEKTTMSVSSEQDRLAFLQSPVEEQLESANALAADVESFVPPKSSTDPSMNEKEVFTRARYGGGREVPSQPPSMRSASPDKGSPPKADPSTPRRGRSMLASLPPRGLNYAVEQAFIVSPARSRSRSRASGSRMFIEVELRDSPGSEARETGQKMMFIRADVNDIEEEDEA
ncbi:hypothetical protein DV736_g1302, partial [Chaetothyriales sp. CBS 134916]